MLVRHYPYLICVMVKYGGKNGLLVGSCHGVDLYNDKVRTNGAVSIGQASRI